MSLFHTTGTIRNNITKNPRGSSYNYNANIISNTSSGSKLPTEDLTLLSNAHGRGRRLERNITKLELKAAIAHGKKQVANPGTDGSDRYRFTYNGVVCITDKTCKQEITAWRLDNEDENAVDHQQPAQLDANISLSVHFIIVVDCSGSMRKDDVKGYVNRKQAVYNCLINDVLQPQAQLQASSKNNSLRKAAATLIEMNDNATVIFERVEISDELIAIMNRRSLINPRSHGNYVPVIDAITKILSTEALNTQVMIIFLSDGAPSDHSSEICKHGDAVFQHKYNNTTPIHCPDLKACMSSIYNRLHAEYSAKIRQLGSMLGENRVQLHTIAFGPLTEDYKVLRDMAAALPKSSFQKLGLNSLDLSSTFSSFTSTLTSLRTESNTMNTLTSDNKHVHKQLTLRTFTTQDDQQLVSDINNKIDVNKWDLYYVGDTLISKEEYSPSGSFIGVPMTTVSGVAVMKDSFAQGAERLAFRCTEFVESKNTIIICGLNNRKDLNGKAALFVNVNKNNNKYICKVIYNQEVISISPDHCMRIASKNMLNIRVIFNITKTPELNGTAVQIVSNLNNDRVQVSGIISKMNYSVKEENFLPRHMVFPPIPVGMKLVAKESKYVEKLSDDTFQEKMARLSHDAGVEAVAFNEKLMNIRSADAIFDINSFRIIFSKCPIYRVKDKKFDDGMGILLSEPELDGKYTKWNNNGGGCNLSTSLFTCIETGLQDLNIIEEGSEEEEEEDDRARLDTPEHLAHVPQCFSHYSYCYSKGGHLICDLQGIWNKQDGFTLTDPALHSNIDYSSDEKKLKIGATDHNFNGIQKFFKTHVCNGLCIFLCGEIIYSWFLEITKNNFIASSHEINNFCIQFVAIKAVHALDKINVPYSSTDLTNEFRLYSTIISYVLRTTEDSFMILCDTIVDRDIVLKTLRKIDKLRRMVYFTAHDK